MTRRDFSSEIDALFAAVRTMLDPATLSVERLESTIVNFSLAARDHPNLLRQGIERTGAVPRLCAELTRNLDEELGMADGSPHYTLLSRGLRASFALDVDTQGASPGTRRHIETLHGLLAARSVGFVCGVFYATEAAALREVRFLRELTDAYARRVGSPDRGESADLARYYDMHLGGVEQGHIDGVAEFVDLCDRHGMTNDDISDGFMATVRAMRAWWQSLTQAA